MTLKQLWETLTPLELSLYRVKWCRGDFGSPGQDLRHGLQCVASGGGRAADWMLNKPKPKEVDFKTGIKLLKTSIDAELKINKKNK